MADAPRYLPADAFGLSPLARLALAERAAHGPHGGSQHPALAAGPPLPATLADFPDPAALLGARLDADERTALAGTLEAHLAPLTPHVAVLDALRKLRHPRGMVVVCGQQPGLCGGPLYNLYKALHAVRLARDLEARWGTPVAALFWNHGDDHDLAEVHHVHLVNPNLDLRKAGLAGLGSGRRPFSDIVLEQEPHRLAAFAELARELLAADPFREAALARHLPRAGETLVSAFTRTLLELLGPHGLVVLEPDWLRVDLSRALADLVAPDPLPALCAAAERLRAAGEDLGPAIDPEEAALVFHLAAGRRRALRQGGEGTRYDGEEGSRTPAELAAEIVQAPADYSAGALLRPLVQDVVLPVAAYVGGLGELAYHVQLGALRAQRGLPATPFVPRASVTLLEPEVEASLATLGLDLPAFLAEARGGAGGAHEGPGPGAAMAAVLRERGRAARALVTDLRADLEALEGGLGVQAKRLGGELQKAVERLAAKVERVVDNRGGATRRHRRRALAHLLPRGGPQERSLSILQLTARHGTAWIGALLEDLDPLPLEHLVWPLADAQGKDGEKG